MPQPELHRVDLDALGEPMASCGVAERMRGNHGPDGQRSISYGLDQRPGHPFVSGLSAGLLPRSLDNE